MPNATPIQILVLDDEPAIRRLLEKELSADHRMITTAATAAEAFEIIRKKIFDRRQRHPMPYSAATTLGIP